VHSVKKYTQKITKIRKNFNFTITPRKLFILINYNTYTYDLNLIFLRNKF